MKADVKLCSDLRAKYNNYFKTGEVFLRSFHDLLWQIAVNRCFKTVECPIIFHINAAVEHGNELVLAFESGGYRNTGVYFIDSNYDNCIDIAEELNELFFKVDKKDQMIIMRKSMSL